MIVPCRTPGRGPLLWAWMINSTTTHACGRAWPSHLVVLGLAFGTTKGFALRP